MPQRSMMPTQPQLRVACDACNSAKVKCSQERPDCRRCEAREIPCHYSVSLRARKKTRPPSSGNNSTMASTVCSIATSSNFGSAETSENVSMSPPSEKSINNFLSNTYNQNIPLFDNDNTISSLWEDWSPDFTSQTFQQPYSDPSDDSFPPMPSCNTLQKQNVSYGNPDPSRVMKEKGCPHLLTKTIPSVSNIPLADSPSSSYIPSPTSTAVTCQCQQNILQKLSELSHLHQTPDQSVPFDQSLSINRSIVALCTSTVNCTNRHHDNDIVLLLTHMALLTHVVMSYDHIFRAHYQALDCSEESDRRSHQLHPAKRQHSNSQRGTQFGESSGRVRLSLGSYELDHRDEQLLQGSLMKIELSKVRTLIEEFEKRFYSLDWDAAPTGSEEGKPLGEVITWLKGRLRMNYKALTSLGLGA